MKITKELYEKTILEIANEKLNPNYDCSVISLTLQKILGKSIDMISVFCLDDLLNLSMIYPEENDIKEFENLLEEISRDYPHESFGENILIKKGNSVFYPGFFNTISEGMTPNAEIIVESHTWLLDDMVISIRQDIRGKCFSVGTIFYTSDSIQKAIDILTRYYKKYQEVFGGRIERQEEIYRVDTVVLNNSGRYVSNALNIRPSASLKTPDFLDNYNTDFPENKIKNFLRSDVGGICIFNGKPGCGKSTYIKRMIYDNSDIRFVILPQYLLLDQDRFRMFLLNGWDGEKRVFIVEDCEQLLIKREENGAKFSSILGDILNYIDGLYGDLTRTKMIFTFNTDLKNIDDALLRKGRLRVRYEFCPLKGENLEKIANKTGYKLSGKDRQDGVSLADLYYNYEEPETKEVSKKKRIGFVDYEEEETKYLDPSEPSLKFS